MLMAVCNLLNTYSPADIGRALMTYSRDENADKFIDRFINKSKPGLNASPNAIVSFVEKAKAIKTRIGRYIKNKIKQMYILAKIFFTIIHPSQLLHYRQLFSS